MSSRTALEEFMADRILSLLLIVKLYYSQYFSCRDLMVQAGLKLLMGSDLLRKQRGVLMESCGDGVPSSGGLWAATVDKHAPRHVIWLLRTSGLDCDKQESSKLAARAGTSHL